jgi:hypothetical protein
MSPANIGPVSVEATVTECVPAREAARLSVPEFIKNESDSHMRDPNGLKADLAHEICKRLSCKHLIQYVSH